MVRKVIVSTYMTLDGVIQPLDWSLSSQDPAAAEERGKYAHDLLFNADALLLGRETYQVFAEVWPTRTAADDDPGRPVSPAESTACRNMWPRRR